MSHAPPHPVQKSPQPQGHKEFEPGHHPGHEHPDFLAHHFETPVQQFEAGKLGMWLFLATEVLLFGGLFCAYAVWRGNHPELFKYGSQFLDTTMGATNTVVLILSSLTMAWAVTAAQQSKRGLLILMLCLTLLGAVTFMVIKYFEYTHKFHEGWYPGIKFYEVPGESSHTFRRPGEQTEHTAGVAPERSGVVPPGEPTTPSGRPDQRADVPPVPTPAPQRGEGEATAAQPQQPQQPSQTQPSQTQPSQNQPQTHSAQSTDQQGGFEVQTIAVTPAQGPAMPPADAPSFEVARTGPRGLAPDPALTHEDADISQQEGHEDHQVHPLQDPRRPPNTHMFFNIYFMMTGLHGIHVLIGMIVIGWLLLRAIKGHFNAEYFTPVDLGGLYWHIVDLIWIFLFPLFYLI